MNLLTDFMNGDPIAEAFVYYALPALFTIVLGAIFIIVKG